MDQGISAKDILIKKDTKSSSYAPRPSTITWVMQEIGTQRTSGELEGVQYDYKN